MEFPGPMLVWFTLLYLQFGLGARLLYIPALGKEKPGGRKVYVVNREGRIWLEAAAADNIGLMKVIVRKQRILFAGKNAYYGFAYGDDRLELRLARVGKDGKALRENPLADDEETVEYYSIADRVVPRSESPKAGARGSGPGDRQEEPQRKGGPYRSYGGGEKEVPRRPGGYGLMGRGGGDHSTGQGHERPGGVIDRSPDKYSFSERANPPDRPSSQDRMGPQDRFSSSDKYNMPDRKGPPEPSTTRESVGKLEALMNRLEQFVLAINNKEKTEDRKNEENKNTKAPRPRRNMRPMADDDVGSDGGSSLDVQIFPTEPQSTSFWLKNKDDQCVSYHRGALIMTKCDISAPFQVFRLDDAKEVERALADGRRKRASSTPTKAPEYTESTSSSVEEVSTGGAQGVAGPKSKPAGIEKQPKGDDNALSILDRIKSAIDGGKL